MIKMLVVIFLVVLGIQLCMFTSASALSAPLAPNQFTNNDKIAFIGDSITHYGSYYMFISEYYLTRYPDRKITFINNGISGDVASGGLSRVKTDILINKPNKAVVMFGMNDLNRGLYNTEVPIEAQIQSRESAIVNYANYMDQLVTMLIANKVQVILLGPSPFDQTMVSSTANAYGYNDSLQKAVQIVKGLAEKHHTSFVDFNSPMVEINRSIQSQDPTKTIIGSDRVHPGILGHNLMAYLFMKSQGFRKNISSVEIDNLKAELVKTDNCTVEALSFKEGVLQYDYKAKSLPLFVDSTYTSLDALVAITEEFNQENILIKNLKAGKYQLNIDEISLGEYSNTQLENGINIATLSNNPVQNTLLQIRNISLEKYNWEIKLRDKAMIERDIERKGYDVSSDEDVKRYYEDTLTALEGNPSYAFNKTRLDNVLYARKNKDLIVQQINEKENQRRKLAQPLIHKVKLTKLELKPQPQVQFGNQYKNSVWFGFFRFFK